MPQRRTNWAFIMEPAKVSTGAASEFFLARLFYLLGEPDEQAVFEARGDLRGAGEAKMNGADDCWEAMPTP